MMMKREEPFMASNPEFVQYIADQLAPAGQVTYHKMFGDYGVYLEGSSCSAATQSPAV